MGKGAAEGGGSRGMCPRSLRGASALLARLGEELHPALQRL